MSVRRLDTNHDWTFGRSLANLSTQNEEVSQSVETRLMSFMNDWFLDVDAGLNWWTFLSQKNQQTTMERAIREMVEKTDGVLRLNDLQIYVDKNRKASISITLTTIYNKQILQNIEVPR